MASGTATHGTDAQPLGRFSPGYYGVGGEAGTGGSAPVDTGVTTARSGRHLTGRDLDDGRGSGITGGEGAGAGDMVAGVGREVGAACPPTPGSAAAWAAA